MSNRLYIWIKATELFNMMTKINYDVFATCPIPFLGGIKMQSKHFIFDVQIICVCANKAKYKPNRFRLVSTCCSSLWALFNNVKHAIYLYTHNEGDVKYRYCNDCRLCFLFEPTISANTFQYLIKQCKRLLIIVQMREMIPYLNG